MSYSVIHADTANRKGVPVYERPISPGWVYPCTADDIRRCLERVPAGDLEGLAAVILAPATRKDHSADARYFFGTHPVIEVYSHAESLTYKQPSHTRLADIETNLATELWYGMTVRRVGARWFCDWTPQNLRRFILEHVFLHEIGHHIFQSSRQCERLGYKTGRSSEAFADRYAQLHGILLVDLFR